MKNYFEEFYERFEALKSDLEIKNIKTVNSKGIKSILNKGSKGGSDLKNMQTLNNLIMAGLGMSTLYLRMGAVVMIAEKTKPGAEADVSFLKVIAEKLIHKLPADGEWKDIWKAYLTKNNNSVWNKIVNDSPSIPDSKGLKIYELFVTFRNNIVHQDIIIKSGLADKQIEEILKGLKILDAMSSFRQRFKSCIISFENDEVYFQYNSKAEKLKISPYVQFNKEKKRESIGILPYIFQGKYYKGSKFINTEGAETDEEKDSSIEETFEKIQQDIAQFNGDKAFDFKEKIAYYNEWCVGREDEVNDILEWIIDEDTDKKVLPVFGPAGLGKGALVAEVIKRLEKNKIKHLYHFCGSGAANNLQAILYHLIIQGKEKKYWNTQSLPDKFNNKLERFPSQYTDVIELFQVLLLNSKTASKVNQVNISDLKKSIEEATNNNNKVKPLIGKYNQLVEFLIALEYNNNNNELVSECLGLLSTSIKILRQYNEYQDSFYPKLIELHRKLCENNIQSEILSFIEERLSFNSVDFKKPLPALVIIIDGLDEAAVADHSKRISDWFYLHNDKGERKEKWIAPDHIKWIFTYRQTSKDNKEGFQFEYHEFNTFSLELVQPLKGISPEAVKNGLQIEFEKLEPALTDDFLETIIKKAAVK